jgi:hypothetical protein
MKSFFLFCVLTTMTLPAVTSAQGLTYTLDNPLAGSGITSVEGLITAVLNVLLIIAVPVIIFFIVFAGFSYVTAQGNPEKIKQASRSLTYAIIGGVLILGAVAISEIIAGVVNSFSS